MKTSGQKGKQDFSYQINKSISISKLLHCFYSAKSFICIIQAQSFCLKLGRIFNTFLVAPCRLEVACRREPEHGQVTLKRAEEAWKRAKISDSTVLTQNKEKRHKQLQKWSCQLGMPEISINWGPKIITTHLINYLTQVDALSPQYLVLIYQYILNIILHIELYISHIRSIAYLSL